MPTLTRTQTLAERAAQANFSANHRALSSSQPTLINFTDSRPRDLEWVFGRDGSLTARKGGETWLGSCSLPARAAMEMLRKLDVSGAVACFLAPGHAAQIRAALAKMRPEQAIVALVPDESELTAMLHCEDFSQPIRSNRLWFVTGDGWEGQLAKLLDEHPGLGTPGQFIRVPASAAELIDRLIPHAQRVIGEVIKVRSNAIQSLRELSWRRPSTTRLLVVAPTQFRLWNDVGEMLIAAAREACDQRDDLSWTLFDADDPASSTPLALASLARQCSAMITSNTSRADLAPIIPLELPWITWITGSRLPPAGAAGPHDRQILADVSMMEPARRAGWTDDRLHLGTWRRTCDVDADSSRTGPVAIVADTRPLDAPEALQEYSSHNLLWEAIREDVLTNPFVLRTDIGAYLTSRMHQANISPDGFPRAVFLNELIVPAFQQGIASLLIQARVPIRIFGAGWSDIERFTGNCAGAVESRRQLAQILRCSRAVVHVWPGSRMHAIERCGAPVLRPLNGSATGLLNQARDPAAISSCGAKANTSQLDGALLSEILREF